MKTKYIRWLDLFTDYLNEILLFLIFIINVQNYTALKGSLLDEVLLSKRACVISVLLQDNITSTLEALSVLLWSQYRSSNQKVTIGPISNFLGDYF
jgi:hypothetical protein